MFRKSIFSLLLIIFPFTLIQAEEGMWLPSQLAKLPWSELRNRGLELSLDQLYSESIPSIKDAIAKVGEGTGSFVSSNGLILTNYHVVVAALQTRQDFIKNGYTARKAEEEVPIPMLTAKILVSMKEVTQEVLSAVNEGMSATDRAKALKSKIAEIEAREKGNTDYECQITDIFFGMRYFLSTYEVVRDIRLVLMPPKSIGAFGGEEDNWMWPRHSGDFAFLRAYVGQDGKHGLYATTNVPFKPKMVLPLSVKGYTDGKNTDGTFTFVMGYPGITLRQMASPGLQAAQDATLPFLNELTDAQLEIIRKGTLETEANIINYAPKLQGMANTSKYIKGTLTAVKKKKVITTKQAEEVELWDHIFADSSLQERYGTVMIELDSAYARYSALSKKQIVTSQLISNIQILRIAAVFQDYASTFKDGEQPNPAYKNNLMNFYNATLKITDLAVDKDLLLVLLTKAWELPKDQQFAFVNAIVGKKKGKEAEKELSKFVDKLYKGTKVSKKDTCDVFVNVAPSKINKDVFVKFAIEYNKENKTIQEELTTLDATITLLLHKFEEVKFRWKNEDTYPDANGTLRFSYGSVKSYTPRNAIYYDYYTTFNGVMEKESVEEDAFLVPPKLHRLWADRNLGSFVDSTYGDVPVAFITNTDVTGGSSGSPVFNGKGEILGITFDGNWEGMAGDYLYQPSLNRTICADTRYMLFYVEKYTEALNLLQELTIKK